MKDEGFDEPVTSTGCQTDVANINDSISVSMFLDTDYAHFYAGGSGAAELRVSANLLDEVGGSSALEYYETSEGDVTTDVEGNPAVYAPSVGILYMEADDYFFVIQADVAGGPAKQARLNARLAEAILKYGFE